MKCDYLQEKNGCNKEAKEYIPDLRVCNNYLISNCPRYTGDHFSTSMDQASMHGLEKGTSEVPWGFDKQKQRGTTDDNFRQHLLTYHISYNTVTWTSSQCIVTQDSLHLSSTLCGEKKEYKNNNQ